MGEAAGVTGRSGACGGLPTKLERDDPEKSALRAGKSASLVGILVQFRWLSVRGDVRVAWVQSQRALCAGSMVDTGGDRH